jgi:AraC-like DNA-binding protein
LAAEIGMSASKLKTLFPRIFGQPPYVYLRQLRMEKAMTLLVDGGVNVTEAAMEVGYSNISYFSKAFYKQFGMYPSHVRRRSER